MPNNQNPVFTDGETILGDGTVQHPLEAVSSSPASSPVTGASVIATSQNRQLTDATPVNVASAEITLPNDARTYQVMCIASFDAEPDSTTTSFTATFLNGITQFGPTYNEDFTENTLTDVTMAINSALKDLTGSGQTITINLNVTSNGGTSHATNWALLLILATDTD